MSLDLKRPAPVTVGVPVYNGAAFLADSLEALRRQTFSDFQVLIFDNASTDRTAEIAADFAARDARFRHVRQPHNKGALPNFQEVLAAADSPYFMWRAADDYSDANFIEVLHGLLEANPGKDLAVGRVVSMFEGAEIRAYRMPPLNGDGGLRDQNALLFKLHPSWIYGLFRTDALKAVVNRVIGPYGDDPRGWDNLSLMPFLLDLAIVSSDQTCFRQALRAGPVRMGDRRPPLVEPDFDAALALRARFLFIGRQFIRERFPAGPRRLAGEVLLWRYANKNAYKFKHIMRRSLKRAIGLRP